MADVNHKTACLAFSEMKGINKPPRDGTYGAVDV
jgi:hypothetical protein